MFKMKKNFKSFCFLTEPVTGYNNRQLLSGIDKIIRQLEQLKIDVQLDDPNIANISSKTDSIKSNTDTIKSDVAAIKTNTSNTKNSVDTVNTTLGTVKADTGNIKLNTDTIVTLLTQINSKMKTILVVTQAEYDLIDPKDPNTIYLITQDTQP